MIRNIIFDLGGVLLEVDYDKTRDAFIGLGLENFDSIYNQRKQQQLFDRLETGSIGSEEFLEALRAQLPPDTAPDTVREAWNAMLLSLPREKMQTLEAASSQFNSFLLSNTNFIHEEEFRKIIERDAGWSHFEKCFRKMYFSHHIGLKKPSPEIFEKVLSENQLDRKETLFIDDSIQHVEGAKACGLPAALMHPGEELKSVLQRCVPGFRV